MVKNEVDTNAETEDDREALAAKQSGVLRRTLLRAQEVIRGLAQGNGELRREIRDQAYMFLEITNARNCLYRENRTLQQEKKALLIELRDSRQRVAALEAVVNLPRGFSKQYLARVDLDNRIKYAEFIYAAESGAKSYVTPPPLPQPQVIHLNVRRLKGPYAKD